MYVYVYVCVYIIICVIMLFCFSLVCRCLLFKVDMLVTFAYEYLLASVSTRLYNCMHIRHACIHRHAFFDGGDDDD